MTVNAGRPGCMADKCETACCWNLDVPSLTTCPKLTSIQRKQQHGPDGQRDSYDDDDLREPGLVLVLGMHVVHQYIQCREHRQGGHYDRHDDQEPIEPRHLRT